MGIFDVFKKKEQYKGYTLSPKVDTALQKSLIDVGRGSEINSLAPQMLGDANRDKSVANSTPAMSEIGMNSLAPTPIDIKKDAIDPAINTVIRKGVDFVKPAAKTLKDQVVDPVYSKLEKSKGVQDFVSYLNAVDQTSRGELKRDDGSVILTQDLPLPQQFAGASMEVWKNITRGEVSTINSMMEGLVWRGIDEAAPITDKLSIWQQEVAKEDPTFADQLGQGLGSQIVFFIPSFGIGKLATVIGSVSPAVAGIFANSAMTALEAMSEAGSVYKENLDQGKSEKQADKAATNTFLLNAALIGFTNKIGYFGKHANTMKGQFMKLLVSSQMEGVQEFGQEIISNWNTGKQGMDIFEGAGTSYAIGAIIGLLGGGFDMETAKPPLNIKDKTLVVVPDKSFRVEDDKGDSKYFATEKAAKAYLDGRGVEDGFTLTELGYEDNSKIILDNEFANFPFEGGSSIEQVDVNDKLEKIKKELNVSMDDAIKIFSGIQKDIQADVANKENADQIYKDAVEKAKMEAGQEPAAYKAAVEEARAGVEEGSGDVQSIYHMTDYSSEDIKNTGFKMGKNSVFGEAAFFAATPNQLYGENQLEVKPSDFNLKTFETLTEQQAYIAKQGAKNLSEAIQNEGKYDGFVIPQPNSDQTVYGITNKAKLNTTLNQQQFITTEEALSMREDFKFLEELGIPTTAKNKLMTPQGKVAYGRYSAGMIEFINNPHKTTLPHETVHAFLDLMLTSEEKAEVINEVKRRYAGQVKKMMERRTNLTEDMAAEEVLADDFAKYYLDKKQNGSSKKSSSKLRQFYDWFVENLNGLFENKDKLTKLYKDIEAKKPSTAQRQRAIEKMQAGSRSIRDLQMEYYQQPENLTTKFLEHTEIKNREFSSYLFLKNLLNSKSLPLKEVERVLIGGVLDTQFKDQKRINMEEFKKAVIGELMPLDIIETDTYADYGSSNVGLSGEKATTYIFNSNFEHGYTGHFSSDFKNEIKRSEIEIKQIPTTDQWAVMKKGVELTEENIAENVYHVASTENNAGIWVERRAKLDIMDSDIRRSDAISSEIVDIGKVGLFAHARTFDNVENNISHIAEIQSDSFQNLDRIDSTAKKISDLQSNIRDLNNDTFNAKDAMRDNRIIIDGRKNLIKFLTTKSSLRDEVVSDPTSLDYSIAGRERAAEITEKFNIPDFILSGFRNLYVDGQNLDQSELIKQSKEKIDDLTKDIKRLDKRAKDIEVENNIKIEKLRNDIATLDKPYKEENQFLQYKNIWHERSIREIIRQKASEGFEALRFPTPRTLALIEGYVSGGDDANLMPYEINSGESDRLEVGDTIIYGGETLEVVQADSYSITVAPEGSTRSFSHNDAVDEAVQSRWEEVAYAWEELEKDFGEITTSEKAQEVTEQIEELNTYIRRRRADASIEEYNRKLKDENYEYSSWEKSQNEKELELVKKYPKLENAKPKRVSKKLFDKYGQRDWEYTSEAESILEKMVNDDGVDFSIDTYEDEIRGQLAESESEIDYRDMYGEDHVFYEEDGRGYDMTVTVVNEDAHVERFDQPDQYEETESIEDFSIDKFDGEQKTVLNFYEKQVNRYLAKLRKGNWEMITDESGNQWFETKVTPEDKGAVEAFQTAENFIEDPKKYSGDYVADYVNEIEKDKANLSEEALAEYDDDFQLDDYLRNIITNQEFILKPLKIKDLIESDADLRTYIETGEQRYPEGADNLDAPIVVGNWDDSDYGVLDGYNRILTKYNNGDQFIEAYVSEPNAKYQLAFDDGWGQEFDSDQLIEAGIGVEAMGFDEHATVLKIKGVPAVGYSWLNGSLSGFSVAESFRGQGIAKQFIRELAQEDGGVLRVEDPNESMMAVLRSVGDVSDPSGAGTVTLTLREDAKYQEAIFREGGDEFTRETNLVARERFNIPQLEKLSFGGSDRDVYKLGKNVLKVAKSARGLAQNSLEGEPYAPVPEVIERGDNYVVTVMADKPNQKTKDLVKALQRNKNFNSRIPAVDMLNDTAQEYFDAGDEDMGSLIQDLNNYSVMINDITAIRNWGTIDGDPILVDAGSLDTSIISDYEGKTNLSDSEFRDIYKRSRLAKEKYGDLDNKTKYQEAMEPSKKADLEFRRQEANEKRMVEEVAAELSIIGARETNLEYNDPELEIGYQNFIKLAKRRKWVLEADEASLKSRLTGINVDNLIFSHATEYQVMEQSEVKTNDDILEQFKDRYAQEEMMKEIAQEKTPVENAIQEKKIIEKIVKEQMTGKNYKLTTAIRIVEGIEKPITITKKESVLLKKKLRDMARAAKTGANFGRQEMRDTLTDAFSTKAANLAMMKKAVATYADGLPLGERGKMIKTVANLKTKGDLVKAYARIDAAMEASDGKTQLEQIKAKAKKLKKAMQSGKSISVDYQKMMADILQDYDLSKPTQKTLDKLASLGDFIEANPDINIQDHLLKRLDRLNKKSVKDIGIEDVKELNDLLGRLWSLGSLKLELQRKAGERATNEAVIKVLTTTEDIDSTPYGYLAVLHAARVADVMDGYSEYKGQNVKMQKRLSRAAQSAEISSKNIAEDVTKLASEIKNTFTDEDQAIMAFHLLKDMGQFGRMEALVSTYAEEFGWKSEEDIVKTDEIQAVMDILRKAFSDRVDRVAAISEEIQNIPFVKVDNYFPLKDSYKHNKTIDVNTPTINQMTQFQGKQTEKGFTFKRVKGVKNVPRIDVFNVFAEAVGEQEYYMHVQPVINEVGKVVNDPRYKAAVGNNGAKWWNEYLKVVASRGRSLNRGIYDKALRRARLNLSVAVLGFKASSALVQPTALIDAASYVFLNHGTRAATELFTSLLGVLTIPNLSKNIVKQSPALQLRTAGETAIRELQEAKFNTKFAKKYRLASMYLLQKLDTLTAAAVHRAMYRHFIREGFSESDARMEADFVMNLTQVSSATADLPLVHHEGEIARTILTFQTFAMGRFGLIAHDIIMSAIVKGKFPRKLKGMIALMIILLAGGLEDELRRKVNNTIRGKSYPEKYGFITQSLLSLPAAVPVIGNVFNAVVEYNSGFSFPLSRAMENLVRGGARAIDPAGQTEAEREKNRGKGILMLSEALLSVGGVAGISQIMDIVERKVYPPNETSNVIGTPARMPSPASLPKPPAMPKRPSMPTPR